MSLHYLVKGDTGSQLKTTLTRNDTGDPIDTTSKVVKLKVRKSGSTSLSFTLTASNLDATNGIIIFDFSTNTANLAAGYYEGEIELTNEDTSVETVYETLKFQVRDDF